MGAFIQRGQLSSLGAVLTSLHNDLKENGFTSVLPANEQPLTLTSGAGVFVMDAPASVNPVHAEQPWRIRVEVTSGDYMTVVIAGTDKITNTGGTFKYPEVIAGTVVNGLPTYTPSVQVMGHLGDTMTPSYVIGTPGNSAYKPADGPGNVFIGRGAGINSALSETYNKNAGVHYGYTLSISDHGVVFYIWENTTEDKPLFSMFCVQSPVNKDTGEPLQDLKSPIFCVFCNDNTGFRKFIVNESDVSTPTKPVPAGVDSVNSAAILNEEEQVAVKLDNKYLITFPNRVNTERFAYSEELDLIAYTSADVIGEDTVLPITVYGEEAPRLYRAMKANGNHNTKMRLLVLQQGAGISAVEG